MDATKQEMPDLFGAWRDFVNKSQESMEETMRQTMETDEFAKALGKYLELTLVQNQAINRTMQQYLQNTPVPTRADVTRLAGQVVNLDGKVERLQTYCEDTLEPAVKGLSQQLSRLEEQVGKLMSRLGDSGSEVAVTRPAATAATPAETATTPAETATGEAAPAAPVRRSTRKK